MGGEIPRQNDIPVPDNNREVILPIIEMEEKQQIHDIFEYTDARSLESKNIILSFRILFFIILRLSIKLCWLLIFGWIL